MHHIIEKMEILISASDILLHNVYSDFHSVCSLAIAGFSMLGRLCVESCLLALSPSLHFVLFVPVLYCIYVHVKFVPVLYVPVFLCCLFLCCCSFYYQSVVLSSY